MWGEGDCILGWERGLNVITSPVNCNVKSSAWPGVGVGRQGSRRDALSLRNVAIQCRTVRHLFLYRKRPRRARRGKVGAEKVLECGPVRRLFWLDLHEFRCWTALNAGRHWRAGRHCHVVSRSRARKRRHNPARTPVGTSMRRSPLCLRMCGSPPSARPGQHPPAHHHLNPAH